MLCSEQNSDSPPRPFDGGGYVAAAAAQGNRSGSLDAQRKQCNRADPEHQDDERDRVVVEPMTT
jgi:hypothetical protein